MCRVVMDPDLSEGCGLGEGRLAWQKGEKDNSREGEARACCQIIATRLLGVRTCVS